MKACKLKMKTEHKSNTPLVFVISCFFNLKLGKIYFWSLKIFQNVGFSPQILVETRVFTP